MESGHHAVGKDGCLMIFATDSKYWIKRVTEDAAKYPGEITVVKTPAENNGVLEAVLSQQYLAMYEETTQNRQE